MGESGNGIVSRCTEVVNLFIIHAFNMIQLEFKIAHNKRKQQKKIYFLYQAVWQNMQLSSVMLALTGHRGKERVWSQWAGPLQQHGQPPLCCCFWWHCPASMHKKVSWCYNTVFSPFLWLFIMLSVFFGTHSHMRPSFNSRMWTYIRCIMCLWMHVHTYIHSYTHTHTHTHTEPILICLTFFDILKYIIYI